MTVFARFSILATFAAAGLFAAPPSRIQGPIQRNRMAALRGHVHQSATAENDRGPVPDSFRVENLILMLKPSNEQASDLDAFLEQQRDPASPDYQRWLTLDEFGERFGANPSDIGALTSWLESEGFESAEVARGRNWVTVHGTAGQVARTFRTALHRYSVEGVLHFANETDPSIPVELAGLVGDIRGLHDFRPHPQRSAQARPEFNASNGAHYVAPDDLSAIYNLAALYKGGYDGTGMKIVIPGQTNIRVTDIRAFRSRFGLPVKDPQIVLFGADPGTSPEDQLEAHLDVEWSGAVAKNSTIVYVNSKNVFTSLQYAIDQNLAPVISLSYGGCETVNPAGFRTVAQQANAQGITWLNASGDSGAAGCDYNVKVATGGPAVIFPANIPEVTAVGGTEFNETAAAGWAAQNNAVFGSAAGYVPEKAWNDTALGQGLSATGGGASQVYTKPWWQTGLGVPDDKARDVPDVSLTASGAHDGYLIVSGGQLMAIGGTSASSPAFAGIVALLNQYLVSKGTVSKVGLGNINPALYNLAARTTDIFHDTTVGDNIVPCAAGSKGCSTGSFGYKAGPGYDLVTGLGSVDAYNLVTKWNSQPAGVGTTSALTANPTTIAPTGSTQLTLTVTPVSGTALPGGTVAFALGGTALGTAPVMASAGKSTATLTVKGSNLTAGANQLVAAYVATAGFSNSTASVQVTVTAPVVNTTTAVTSSSVTVAAGGQLQVTATVKAAGGTAIPNGTVTFAAGPVSLGTTPLNSAGVAAISIAAAKLAVGSNTIKATYSGANGFSTSAGSLALTVLPAAVATTTTAVAAVSTLQPSGSTMLTVTVKAAAGTTKPAGSVSFLLGKAVLSSIPLTAAGTATLIIKASSLVTGANVITVNYAGNAAFTASSDTVTVTVTPAAVATTTKITAAPASFAQNGSTLLTATVTPATAGTIIFTLGTKQLGTALVTGTGTASLTLKGSLVPVGTSTITAGFAPTGNFTGSSSTVKLTVTPAAAKS